METIQAEMKNANKSNIYTDGKQILGTEKENTRQKQNINQFWDSTLMQCY